jgi:hypothetical protein
MRRLLVLLAALTLFVLGGLPAQGVGADRAFVATLSGDNEVPPNDSKARGSARFVESADGSEMDFTLAVGNIDNVFAAHIHCAPPGVNGPIGVTLFMGSGAGSGLLAQGTITAPDAGNACGWTTLQEVITALESGDTYVNVHTDPGFPGGEIRGQVR